MLAFATPTADVPIFMTVLRHVVKGVSKIGPWRRCRNCRTSVKTTTPEPAGKHTAGDAPPAYAADVGNWNAVNRSVFTSIVIDETVVELVTLNTLAAPEGLLVRVTSRLGCQIAQLSHAVRRWDLEIYKFSGCVWVLSGEVHNGLSCLRNVSNRQCVRQEITWINLLVISRSSVGYY